MNFRAFNQHIPALLLSLAMMNTAVMASEESVETVWLPDNRAVVQVKGMVCSFCAYGTEKNLGKLGFLDKSEYGGDGVLLNIEQHRITLALDPSKPVDFSAIHRAILDGGYDPVSAVVRVHGRVESGASGAILTSPTNGQRWRLEGQDFKTPTPGQAVVVEGRIATADFAEVPATGIIPILVIKLEARQ